MARVNPWLVNWREIDESLGLALSNAGIGAPEAYDARVLVGVLA